MDILEANIPQAIPRAIEEPPSATFGERLRNQARIARFDYGIPSQKLIIGMFLLALGVRQWPNGFVRQQSSKQVASTL